MKGIGVLGLAAGLALAAWLLVREATVSDLEGKLIDRLPARLAQWAPELAAAAEASRPGSVDLSRWAFTFAYVIDRESAGGNALHPRGPAGLGDYGHGHGLGQVDDRPAKDSASEYERRLSGLRLAHIASGDWKDPAKHLRFCAAAVLRGAWDQFGDLADQDARLAAAVAAYNSGVDNVREQLDAGLDVDGRTTGHDYSASVLSHAGAAEEIPT